MNVSPHIIGLVPPIACHHQPRTRRAWHGKGQEALSRPTSAGTLYEVCTCTTSNLNPDFVDNIGICRGGIEDFSVGPRSKKGIGW